MGPIHHDHRPAPAQPDHSPVPAQCRRPDPACARAAYYALRRAFELPAYGPDVTRERIAAHFTAIQPLASELEARGGALRARRVVLAGGTESLSTMPMSQKRLAGGAQPQLWMSPSHPETPDAPAFDMSISFIACIARRTRATFG